MGRVKEFAMWLGECVYERGMSNARIMSACQSMYPRSFDTSFQNWLDEQIEIVKANPQLYSPFDEDNSSTKERYMGHERRKR